MREFASNPPEEVHAGDALREAGHTVAVAESCTDGLVGSPLTDVPGSSDYFDRSLVTYSYDAKRHELAVSRESLDEHGAVFGAVAREMAAGVRDVADATWGPATTGIAGPEGGLPGKPVGTAFVGVAFAAPWGSGDSYARIERFEYDGSWTQVKEWIARGALALFCKEIESESVTTGRAGRTAAAGRLRGKDLYPAGSVCIHE